MANVFLSIGQVNITGYMLIVLRYTDDPNAEVDRDVIAPGDIGPVNNVTFNGLQPKPVFVDVRESPDGTALGTLLSTFQVNITEKVNVLERRFYTVGGSNIGDPLPGTYVLDDPYFDGKVVSGVFREGFRHLMEGEEWQRDGTEIQLLNPDTHMMDGPVFNPGEVYIVEISYLQDRNANISQEGFTSFSEITTNTTLTSANRQKVNVINASANVITINLESVASLPEGDWYEFITNDGSQKQVIIKCNGADSIRYAKIDRDHITLGVGEFLRLAKYNGLWEVVRIHSNAQEVGRFFKSYRPTELNALLCNGALYNGADYPRILHFIKSLPANFVITDSGITSLGWSPDSLKSACWHYWNDGVNEWFRVPDKQNLFGRNLKQFVFRGTDSTRYHDYPGGIQTEDIGKHIHYTAVDNDYSSGSTPSALGRTISAVMAFMRAYTRTSGTGNQSYELLGSTSKPTVSPTSDPLIDRGMMTPGEETRPRNFGEYEFVKI